MQCNAICTLVYLFAVTYSTNCHVICILSAFHFASSSLAEMVPSLAFLRREQADGPLCPKTSAINLSKLVVETR